MTATAAHPDGTSSVIAVIIAVLLIAAAVYGITAFQRAASRWRDRRRR